MVLLDIGEGVAKGVDMVDKGYTSNKKTVNPYAQVEVTRYIEYTLSTEQPVVATWHAREQDRRLYPDTYQIHPENNGATVCSHTMSATATLDLMNRRAYALNN